MKRSDKDTKSLAYDAFRRERNRILRKWKAFGYRNIREVHSDADLARAEYRRVVEGK